VPGNVTGGGAFHSDGYDRLINLERYPIHDLQKISAAEWKRMRDTFSEKGVLVLDEFLLPERMADFIAEANQLAPVAFHNEVVGNAYLTETDMTQAEDHPARMTERTALGAVAYDQFPANNLMRRVYEWRPVMDFVAAILGKPVYQYACPMGALNLSVMRDGDYLRWHFDLSDFVVSIHLQEAEIGGLFEYCHNIRQPDQPNLAGIRNVLRGDMSSVETLHADPGAMILFQGRYTMHRVSEIRGKIQRLVALFGYVDQPGQTSTEYLRKIRYGRS